MKTTLEKTTKLEPVTITITDQQVLRRLHKAAGRCHIKPQRLAQRAFNTGLWESVLAIKDLDAIHAAAVA